MSNKAFLDTNLAISNVFQLNSLHLKSKTVFDTYTKLFWSHFVKDEFKNRYERKLDNLSKFYQDLQKFLENPNQELYSFADLNFFALENYSNVMFNDAKSSVKPFWGQYIGIESKIPFYSLINAINHCIKDLSVNTGINKDNLEKSLILTPQRIRSYDDIDNMLKSEGVKDADRIVTLDGHDFACRSDDPIDFVTFDECCFNGASNVEILCFNSVKGKYDFEPS